MMQFDRELLIEMNGRLRAILDVLESIKVWVVIIGFTFFIHLFK